MIVCQYIVSFDFLAINHPDKKKYVIKPPLLAI